MNHRPARRQQATGASGVTRVKRVAVAVKDEHGRMNLTVRSLGRRSALGVTPVRRCGRTGLPSPMVNTRYRREAVSVSR
ncbi:hypothetical protein ABZ260_51305, partial [Streptosporangium sp. NPDC006013]|uniref:hypothetical protein n=1 Tax=Streptosporangium sp. NPDC006013 TaxID=3155596 RepID=UPI0033BE2914